MTAEGAANGPGQTIAPVTRFSVLTSAVVGVILIGAGFGIGIGIGAGIWKDSSTTDSEPAPEWFFAQQADSVRVVKRSPDSDEFVVSMDGVGGLASAMTAQPSLRAGYVGQDELVAALNDDPGKNAMLICDQGDSKIALPLSVESGVVTGDNVSYMARLVPFNKGTWDRVDEGRMLNASSVLSSFEAGEVVEFDSSCYMFIDALGDWFDAGGFGAAALGAVATLHPAVTWYAIYKDISDYNNAGDDQEKKDAVKSRMKYQAAGFGGAAAVEVGGAVGGIAGLGEAAVAEMIPARDIFSKRPKEI